MDISFITSFFTGLVTNLTSDLILTWKKGRDSEHLLRDEKAREDLRAFRPVAEDVRLACLKLADQQERLWVSPEQQMLRPLLLDPCFHQDFVDWLQCGAIEEGQSVKQRIILRMEDLLTSAQISEKQHQYLRSHLFEALDKAVFADDVLARWRFELSLRFLRDQQAEQIRLVKEAAGKYSEEKKIAALDAYCQQALDSWDIIDLSNLPGDRDLATQQLLLRQLYMPLRIGFEALRADRDDQDMLVGFEQHRSIARLRDAGRSGVTDSRAIDIIGDPVAIGERLGVGQRSVVLGDPGGGKTTMMRWLATAYLLRHTNDPAFDQLPDAQTLPPEDWIPVLIRCRDIGEADLCRSFEDVLAIHLSKTELQPQEAEVMKHVILDRLTRGKILLLVDGLDEISNRSVRQMFCQQLERTAVRYPDAPILVTSRIVGYNEMPDRMRTGFAHGMISDLHPETKDLFACRWVDVTEAHKSKEDKQRSAQDLIAALHSTDRIERLTGNPMLLTTMALVKRNVGKLPTRRNKLYGEAISVLLNWNPNVYSVIDDDEALPQLAYLAYEMCSRGVQRLTGEEVLDLLDQFREDYPRLRAVRQRESHQFLHLLEERSGLLMRSGVQWQPNHSQERAIWEFRHLTFQEYLAAQALNRGYFKDRNSSQTLAEHVAPLAAPVCKEDADALLAKDVVGSVPDSWREALRLLVTVCRDDDVDDVLLSILNPCPGEAAENTQGPRATLAAQCLADEPNVSEETALEILKKFVGLIGDNDGIADIDSTVERVAFEVWRSDPDHRDALQSCLLEAFADTSTSTARHCGAVLAQLLGSTCSITADGLEESIESARANLESLSDEEAICASLQFLELAFQRWFLCSEGLDDKLLDLLDRGGAPGHAAAWAFAWLCADRVPDEASHHLGNRNRLWPSLNVQQQGLASVSGWRPTQAAVLQIMRALEQAKNHEVDLKRHLIGLLGFANHADVLAPLQARLNDPHPTIRHSVLNALASLANSLRPFSRTQLSKLELELTNRLLSNEHLEEQERGKALLLLALFDLEDPLHQLLTDANAPALLRQGAAECLGLLANRCGDSERRECIEAFLEEQLRADVLNLSVEGEESWAEHDACLPPLQGASRALQLAASVDLPLLGSGPGRKVAMLTLTAIKKEEALQICTEVVEPPVWKLPLPAGEQLEIVAIPGGEYSIGSPPEEDGRDWYSRQRERCVDPESGQLLNVEAQRSVRLEAYAMVRHLITQAQWQAVATLEPVEGEINPMPGSFRPEAKALWERYAQPGSLPVDSVSWNDCQEWLRRLNRWLRQEWPGLVGGGEAPQLTLPGEGQWEAARRAGAATPFHFGDVLDASWANYDGGFPYGLSRKGPYRQCPLPIGALGLVNRWGLAEMHGQLWEWCGDQWHPDPKGEGWPRAGLPWEGVDPALEALGSVQKEWKLLRGGSWFSGPRGCRAAIRGSALPASALSDFGVRPCCLLPPGSLLGA